ALKFDRSMGFTLPGDLSCATIRQAIVFFLGQKARSLDQGRTSRYGLSVLESALTQGFARKSFRIRTYEKSRGGGEAQQNATATSSSRQESGTDKKGASTVQPAIFAAQCAKSHFNAIRCFSLVAMVAYLKIVVS